jgi:hypothetical protein
VTDPDVIFPGEVFSGEGSFESLAKAFTTDQSPEIFRFSKFFHPAFSVEPPPVIFNDPFSQ